MTGKHFNNTTLIQMDKNGDYQLVHGPKLRKIKDNSLTGRNYERNKKYVP
jgi:hypothetical protein